MPTHIVEKVKRLMRLRAEIRGELLKQEDFNTRSLSDGETELVLSNYVVAAMLIGVEDSIDEHKPT